MPDNYKAPGVYIEEFESGSRPITGVSTSIAGFVGITETGPTDEVPVFLTSFADYQRVFGGYLPKSYGDRRFLPYAVESFFANGGNMCYVSRIVPSGALRSNNLNVKAGIVMRLKSDLSKGAKTVLNDAFEFTRGIQDGCVVDFMVNDSSDSTTDVTLTYHPENGGFFELDKELGFDFKKEKTIIKVKKINNQLIGDNTSPMKVYALYKGASGNQIKIKAFPSSLARTQIIDMVGEEQNSVTYLLKKNNGFYVGAIVEFFDKDTYKKQYARVMAVQGDFITLSRHLQGDRAVIDKADIPSKVISTCEFSLRVMYNGKVEQFDNLSMNPNTPNYFKTVVNNRSSIIMLRATLTDPDKEETESFEYTSETPFDMPTNDKMLNGEFFIELANGEDGVISNVDTENYKKGIDSFLRVDDISLISVPGISDQNVYAKLVEHCEKLKNRFAVLDLPENILVENKVLQYCDNTRSSYVAFYHPWIKVYDASTKTNIFIPPSGAVLGVYARTDVNRGVHKAPANETVRGATDLKYLYTTEEQNLLNPEGVNLIRKFSGRGILVWGARTRDFQGGMFNYINVRRLFIYLEETIFRNTQWVVFEPNNEKLWTRVRLSISEFLTRVWRSGALMGTKPEQAFYVKCDRTTMTQEDINNGLLIIEIGVAPARPAEFVVFRITQWYDGVKG